jgi:hypothetical protein
MQKILSREQVEEFHHDEFVEEQVRHFVSLVGGSSGPRLVVVDVGGGIGLFAHRLQQVGGHEIRVLDLDAGSIALCAKLGVKCTIGDALNPRFSGDEQMATFNMILHHLVGASEQETRQLQTRALAAWHANARKLFVNEYVYDSFFGNLSGWLIFKITNSRVLSWIGRKVAVVVPSLRANTFGVGVRFRSHDEWRQLFDAAGFRVENFIRGTNDTLPMTYRLLFIKNRRRDSFLLVPAAK